MLLGYILASKRDRGDTLALQLNALREAGVERRRIYKDVIHSRQDAHPGLTACLEALQSGDTLVLWKLDRLGQTLRHLVGTVETLRCRGVQLKVLTGAGARIDTTTFNGGVIFGVFAALAEVERELVSERSQPGRTAARAQGRMAGRPRKVGRTMMSAMMAGMSEPGAEAAEVARRLGIGMRTLYTYVNGDGSPKAAGAAILAEQGVDTTGEGSASKHGSRTEAD